MNKVIVPPIKSQGIKTKLVPFIDKLVPEQQEGRWIEPFRGTGIVGFNLARGPALMCDNNPHIINFYNAIKSGDITGNIVRNYLYSEGDKLRVSGGSYYYKVRDRFNEIGSPLDFLFLSRSCFNGVMRFNRKGGFNVPFCKKPERFSQAYITKIVNQINSVSNIIYNGDFEFCVSDFTNTIASARKNDILYCDPPYIARHADYFNSWDSKDEGVLAEYLSKSEQRDRKSVV